MKSKYTPALYPHKNKVPIGLTLGSYKSGEDDFHCPLTYTSHSYSYFDPDEFGCIDGAYSNRIMSILLAAYDRIVISVPEMYYILGYQEEYISTYCGIQNTFTRCTKEELLTKIPLINKELFYSTDQNVYVLSDKGLDAVSKYRGVDKAYKTKIKKVRESKEKPGRRIEHIYGNDICAFQVGGAYQKIFGFNTDITFEGLPVNYFSDYGRGEVEKASESPFTYDAFICGAGEDESAFVFLEYDRRTEGTAVLNKKLSGYCATSGYISSLPLIHKPGVDNTYIVFACDSGHPYKDEGPTSITVCKRIRDAVGERTWPNDVLTALKSCMKEAADDIRFTKNGLTNIKQAWGFDEKHAAALIQILTYYLKDSEANALRTTRDLLDEHITSMAEGVNPMRADIISAREEFYSFRRLLSLLDTYSLQLSSILNRTYKPPLTPSAEVKMLDGLSIPFIPAVRIGYYACCGRMCDNKIKAHYISLAKKYAGNDGDKEPEYLPVADFHGGLKLPYDRTDLFMRNTVKFESKYVHIEDLCDLGAWLRLYGFVSLTSEEKKGHIAVVLCSKEELEVFRERLKGHNLKSIYFEDRDGFMVSAYQSKLPTKYGLDDRIE